MNEFIVMPRMASRQHDCFTHIAMLFNATVVRGSLPDILLYNTIVPIPKGRGVNISDSSNYRGICLSSLYGKLFDNAVMTFFSSKLITSELQFGFKAKSSTSFCSERDVSILCGQ